MYKAKIVKRMKMDIDGTVYDWAFSNYALGVLDEEFEEGAIKIIQQAKRKPVLAINKLIYAGIKFSAEEQGKEITYRTIANSMLFDVELANKIMDAVNSTINVKTEPSSDIEDSEEDEEKNE